MNKIQLKILGISQGNVASSYTLLLEEQNGERKLPIIIGILEAQAIAISLEKINPIRPMTHDLIKNIADSFSLTIKEVIIYRLFEGIFYSNLVMSDGKVIKEIDTRTSDAIALALRFNCPIYTNEEIMGQAGISVKSFSMQDLKKEEEKNIEEDEEEIEESIQEMLEEDSDLSNVSVNKLRKMLKDAIADEDYIKAAKIRDIIKRIDDDKETHEKHSE